MSNTCASFKNIPADFLLNLYDLNKTPFNNSNYKYKLRGKQFLLSLFRECFY